MQPRWRLPLLDGHRNEEAQEKVRGLPNNRRQLGEQLVRLNLCCLQAGGPISIQTSSPLVFMEQERFIPSSGEQGTELYFLLYF